MQHISALTFAAFVLSATSVSAACPAAPDHSAELSALFEQARQAETESEARELASQMWTLWTDAPDEVAQAMLDRGMTRRESYDFLGALQDLNKLVAYCPHYAEAYNQRAFVNFLRQDFAVALADLNKAIEISPDHVAALSGKALTLLGLGRHDEARDALQKALSLNPWLPERSLANPGGPLAPKGEDI